MRFEKSLWDHLVSFGYMLSVECFFLLPGNVASEYMMRERTMASYSILGSSWILASCSWSGLTLGLVTGVVQVVPSDTNCWRLWSWPFAINSELSSYLDLVGSIRTSVSIRLLLVLSMAPSSILKIIKSFTVSMCPVQAVGNKEYISLVISLRCSVVLWCFILALSQSSLQTLPKVSK